MKRKTIVLILILALMQCFGTGFASGKSYNYIVIDIRENQEYTIDGLAIEKLYGKSKLDVREVFLAFTPEKDGKYVLRLKKDEYSDSVISTERGIPSFAVHIDPSKSEPILTKNNGTLDELLTKTEEDTYYLRAGKSYYYVDGINTFYWDPLSLKIEYHGPVTKKDVMIEAISNSTMRIDNSKSLKSGLKLYFSKETNYKVDGYDIYRSSKEYAVYKKIGTTKKTYYIDKNVKEDTRYFYKVIAYRYIDGEKYTIEWNTGGKKCIYDYE